MGENPPTPTSHPPIFENGLANTNHPSIQSFIRARNELISQERSQRSDAPFRTTLSPTAQKASTLISRIRTQELTTKWSTPTSTTPSPKKEELFPGMMFNIAKPTIETTQLWRIVKKMPKGALLHCHLGAMVDIEWVLETALRMEGMCFVSDVPLTDEDVRGRAEVRFLYYDGEVGGESIWEEGYVGGRCVSVTIAADSFPNGGRKGFISWMKDRCSITEGESLQMHLGVDDVWRKLNAAFGILPGLVYYEPILRAFMKEFFRCLLVDGVRWVEIRCAPFTGYYPEKSMTRPKDPDELLKVLDEEIEAFKKANPGFWGARMIWCSIRTWETEKILVDMEHCLRLKKQYPNLISGYDLVGQEDAGRTLESLTPELLWFQSQCTTRNLNIPLFLHAGETVGTGTPTDQNLYTALLLHSRRLGHAFSLYKHPLLISLAKSQNVLVESCPISNEVLRYTASIMSHPLPALINRGVKACISNDDPAMLGHGTSGLSSDFWLCLQGWEDLGGEGLGALAENSIKWAAFTDETEEEWQKGISDAENGQGIRAQRLKEWKAEWEAFCEWVVEEYS
ncbi:hypothetical protein HYFRA_00001254 [Hymenoscyphus fraxineus]|uniref:adenosine deaminase n=1 Tax=Hymenoscyphus fraxineus TaxID=746836 RepID=A0A9N9L6C6_9HELO|nr:hypothetical protein HYFRA_00001254 [Hymenoscyphus fraxineus]